MFGRLARRTASSPIAPAPAFESPSLPETRDAHYRALRNVTLLGLLILTAVALALSFAGPAANAAGPFLALAAISLVLYTLFEFHRRQQIAQWQHYRQVEALFAVYSCLQPERPLPPMRGWAASPDFLVLALDLILDTKPACVVELGSGSSTVVAGYGLRVNGSGRLYAIEHDEEFAKETRRTIESHRLQDWADVILAPLRPVETSNDSHLWYTLKPLEDLPLIDLLIVDGPPSDAHRSMVRYPAMPMLFGKLRDNAHVLVDDFRRDDERAMVERWLKEYDLVTVRTVPTETGAVILRKAGNMRAHFQSAP